MFNIKINEKYFDKKLDERNYIKKEAFIDIKNLIIWKYQNPEKR